jgi:hypothetical protein
MPKLRFVAETEPVEDVSELFGDLIIIVGCASPCRLLLLVHEADVRRGAQRLWSQPSVTFLSGGSRNVTEVDRRVSSEEVVAALDP